MLIFISKQLKFSLKMITDTRLRVVLISGWKEEWRKVKQPADCIGNVLFLKKGGTPVFTELVFIHFCVYFIVWN